MKGKLSISKYANYRESDDKSIVISVEDELSGTRFVEVSITPRDLMLALTGQGYIDVDFKLRANLVGKIRQVKTDKIPVSGFDVSEDEINELLLIHEVDGWKASKGDFKNHHKHSRHADGQNLYSVNFVRYVDPE